MIIHRDIGNYCVFSGASVKDALKKIDSNNEGIVFCADESGMLEGVLTDGDFRRWIINSGKIDENIAVGEIANRNFVYASANDNNEKIFRLFTDRIRFVPLLDAHRRLTGIARKRDAREGITIANRAINSHEPALIIAEVGINHNGSRERAVKLIDAAAEAEVDCVKFQMRNMDALYRSTKDSELTNEDLGAQYTMNILKKFELPIETMLELFDYSRERGLIPLCTPWDSMSLRVLEDYGMPAYKVASADMTNHPFLTEMAMTYRPLVISTGMSREEEIIEMVKLLQRQGAAYVLLHCNSTYPAPFKDIHLQYMSRLAEIGGCVVGYSGHERGYSVALAAVSMGAKIIEKHISLDRTLEGTDHKVSLLPGEFKSMVEGIRQIEQALGNANARELTQGELMNRSNLAKSLVINCSVSKGDKIEAHMVEIKSPGRGLQPDRLRDLIGTQAKRDIVCGDFFFPTDLEEENVLARPYTFKRPWGVTVRWHDFKSILSKTNPDFLEFHLSSKDMDEDYLQYFDDEYDLDLKVHSPDTFAGDHLLDISNPDPAYRKRSIRELQRVTDLTRSILPYFKKGKKPAIIASLGGFSADAPLSAKQVRERYRIMADSLAEIRADGVEIIGQTLPPFPWYFGGQMYLNLFVQAHDTAEFCSANQLRLCFDISHSKLACNHMHYSFKEFIDIVAPYTAHMHIADASGIDGEGLQVGDGEIDFPSFISQVNDLCPDASFIPEIWQGHKNNGEGFWVALDRLEKMRL